MKMEEEGARRHERMEGDDDDDHLAIPCSRLLDPAAVKPDLAGAVLPKWLRAVAIATEPDVLARLLSLLRNWADSHRARPRIVLETWIASEGTTPPVTATTTVLMGDLAVVVPLEPADDAPMDAGRVAALIAQLEALAGDVGVSKVVAGQRAEQQALARLSDWRCRLERQYEAACTRMRAAEAGAAASIAIEEEEGEGGAAAGEAAAAAAQSDQKLPPPRATPEVIEIADSSDEEEEGEEEEGEKMEEASEGSGGGGVVVPPAIFSMAHDVALLYKENLGAALLASEQGNASASASGKKKGKGKGKGKGSAEPPPSPHHPLLAPGAVTAKEEEEEEPSLPDMLRGLARLGRLALGDVDSFLALHAVVEADEEEEEEEEEMGEGNWIPITWGPRLQWPGLVEEWRKEEEQQQQEAGTETPLPAATPAVLPAGTLYMDRTYLLFLLGRITHIAEAYGAVLGGGQEAPQMRELLRPVASYRFRWGLDPGPANEAAAAREGRWRALCLDNVGRDATQFLVRLQTQEGGGTAEEKGSSRRLLRIEWPHVWDERVLAIFLRFLAFRRQPGAAAGAVAAGGGGSQQQEEEAEDVEKALLAAHQHGGGRLFLWAELVGAFVNQWREQLLGKWAEEEGGGGKEGRKSEEKVMGEKKARI